jgi:anti-sigma regulatory factor (Ser/Thr protein kinase)
MGFRIEVPNERSHLVELLEAIDCVLAENAVAPDVRGDLRLVAEELACNAMDYGQSGDHARTHRGQNLVSVDIARLDDGLHVEFRDTGVPFNPLAQPAPDLDADIGDRPIGGLGVHLVRKIAHSVRYAREEPYNILRVVLRAT